jgi:hypothetical protein
MPRWTGFRSWTDRATPKFDAKKRGKLISSLPRYNRSGFSDTGFGGTRNCVLNPARRIKRPFRVQVQCRNRSLSTSHWLTKPPGTNTIVQKEHRFVTEDRGLFFAQVSAQKIHSGMSRRKSDVLRKNSGDLRNTAGREGRHQNLLAEYTAEPCILTTLHFHHSAKEATRSASGCNRGFTFPRRRRLSLMNGTTLR